MIFHKWNTKMKVFHKNQKKLESDAIIIDQENSSIVICVIPQGQLDCHRRWIEKGKWDTFFPRTLKNSMHPWVYSTRYAGRGKLAGDKIIPLAPLQIKEQSSWNSSLWEEREISHISYFLPPSPLLCVLWHDIRGHPFTWCIKNWWKCGKHFRRKIPSRETGERGRGRDIKPVTCAFWK